MGQGRVHGEVGRTMVDEDKKIQVLKLIIIAIMLGLVEKSRSQIKRGVIYSAGLTASLGAFSFGESHRRDRRLLHVRARHSAVQRKERQLLRYACLHTHNFRGFVGRNSGRGVSTDPGRALIDREVWPKTITTSAPCDIGPDVALCILQSHP